MTAQLTLTRGLPGSGKSTWAAQQVEAHPETTVRINRDDIRTELFGWEYHSGGFNPEDEKQVTEVERERVEAALQAGKHVISDNTYLSTKAINPMVQLARKYKAPISVEAFNVPVEECKRRNVARGKAGGRHVPELVIDNMAKNSYDEHGNLTTVMIEHSGRVRQVPLVTSTVQQRSGTASHNIEEGSSKGSSTVFHIDIHGKPAPCQATVQECRRQRGSQDGVHYATYEEADAAAQRHMTAKYGATSTVTKDV